MSKSKSSNCPNNLVCNDYLTLNTQNVSLYHLLRFLMFKDKDHHIIDCPLDLEEELKSFRYRWLVFISVIGQKILQYIEKPLARFGYFLEAWLNLLSNNGEIVQLLGNLFKGKWEVPNPESGKFKSLLGTFDPRFDLVDSSSAKSTVDLSWMAAKLSYENSDFITAVVQDLWRMKLIGAYSFWNEFEKDNATNTFIARKVTSDSDITVVAFRGTEPFGADDWCTDLDLSWLRLGGVGRVHAGFMKALGLQMVNDHVGWPKEIKMGPNNKHLIAYYEIRQVLRQILKENKDAKFIVTGHSSGAALAILFASVLIIHEEKELLDRLEGVYAYGQPRVGDFDFGEFMMKKLVSYNVKYCRYVYCNDIVPRLPYDGKAIMFKHFGPCLYYDSLYRGKVLAEEPNKNYFSLIWVVPKYLNAVWELVRGFVFPVIKLGPNYTEGWAQHIFRAVGLIIPGLSAHGPQDYTNIVRFGQMHPQEEHKLH